MNRLCFFLKNFLKKPVIVLSVLVLAFVSFFSFSTEKLRSPLPCALCSEDESEEAAQVVNYLEENGFLVVESTEAAQKMVLDGTADMAVILTEDFSEKLEEDSLRECAKLIVSERSQRTSMYKLMAAVAIYQIYMPYTAAETAGVFGYEATEEDISAYSEKIRSQVNPLGFHVISVDGADIEPSDNYDLPIGVVSISCFIMLGFLCVVLVRRRGKAVRVRFDSFGSYFFRCILPQCTAVGILTYAAAAVGVCIASSFFNVPLRDLLIALIPYGVILIFVSAILTVLPVSDHLLICIIAIDAAISLILCPLYSGTNMLLGYIAPFRALSVPYLIYVFLMI